MAITATTLSGAINATQTSFGVASASGITAPISPTGSGFTYLLVESELMFVNGVSGTVVSVTRGVGGTMAVAHGVTAAVVSGAPSDFPTFFPAISSFRAAGSAFVGFSAPVASALAITPSGGLFHVTGTTATATINLPAGFVEGAITIVADGVWTWTAADNIAVAGTVTTAGSAVTFYYDAGKTKWYPSRLA